MEEVLKYITIDEYTKEKSTLRNGESKVVYEDHDIKLKLMKKGRKIYNIIVSYGTEDIEDIAKNLIGQA